MANLLEVFDQETLALQLEDILRALATDLEIRLAPADLGAQASFTVGTRS